MKSYTSAFERLQSLPEVFTGTDLSMAFSWPSAVSSTYLANWRRAGLIKSLGGRSDVHMNLVVNPQVDPERALRRLYPSGVRIGVDILREAGWTTQIPSRPKVVVPLGEPLYAIDDFEIGTRPAAWFEQVAGGIERSSVGVARLRPAWALADMIARAQDRRVRDAWLLDPDDLDLEAVAQEPEMATALQALGLSPEAVDHQSYAELADERSVLQARHVRQRERG